MKRGSDAPNSWNKVHLRLGMTFGLVRSAPPPAAAPSEPSAEQPGLRMSARSQSAPAA